MRPSRRGFKLSEGDRLVSGDYSIAIDTSPEELAEEFRNRYGEPSDYNTNFEALDDVRKFVMDEIPHINAIARQLDRDKIELNEERLEAQSESDTLRMSYLWNGKWRGTRAGTCQERGITLNTLYQEFGFPSRYFEGEFIMDNGVHSDHSWTNVRTSIDSEDRFISDPSKAGEGLIPETEASRYLKNKIWKET